MIGNLPGFFQGTEMPTAGWWEALWPDPAGVLAAVGITPSMEVVDLCSGDGWFTLQIAKIARHVIAIDIDPAMHDLARHRLMESGVTNCNFVTGDAYDLKTLVPGPVDFVFMANAFHGVPDRPLQLSVSFAYVLELSHQALLRNRELGSSLYQLGFQTFTSRNASGTGRFLRWIAQGEG